MGAFWETFFLLVTIVSRNTFTNTKILQNGNFVSQISPQEKYKVPTEKIEYTTT